MNALIFKGKKRELKMTSMVGLTSKIKPHKLTQQSWKRRRRGPKRQTKPIKKTMYKMPNLLVNLSKQ
jgi:hypothetical protein